MSETDLAEVWARSLDELATMQIEPHQRAWLKLTRPLGLVENTALIATPNEFVKEQLETRLRALITHALSRELGRSIQLAVTVDPTAITAATAFPAAPAAPGPGGGQAAGQDDHAGVPGPQGGPMDGWIPDGRGSPGPADSAGLRIPWAAPVPWAARGCPAGLIPGPGRPTGSRATWTGPGDPQAGHRWAVLPWAGPSMRWLAGRSTRAGRPGRCPARPGPPRPGSIPSTPSRPS